MLLLEISVLLPRCGWCESPHVMTDVLPWPSDITQPEWGSTGVLGSDSCVSVEYCEAEMIQTIRNLSNVRVLFFMTKSFSSCRMKQTQKFILKYLLFIASFKKLHTAQLVWLNG